MGKDNQLKDRTGEVSYTKYGTKATTVQYINNKDVLVEFNDDYRFQYHTTYINFKNGRLTNPYDKSIYRIGFIGIGDYDSKHISYPAWFNMIKRCYKKQKSYDDESYDDCIVDKEWQKFQNFAKLYEENMYVCDERLVIDKVIKLHGNRMYSKEYCMLLPEKINLLFIKEKARRGDLPMGVHFHKERDNYVAMCSVDGKTKYIGSYSNPQIAFNHYKEFKEKHIKKVLENYIGILPSDIYKAVENYKIEITD